LSRPKTSKSIVREIEVTHKANLKLLSESMAGLPKNCKAYLDRLLAKAKLEQQYRFERSARGIDPPNLGTATKVRYEFSAVISEQEGQVDATRQAWEQSLDEEFPSDNPHLRAEQQPAPPTAKKLKKKRSNQ
jgi:hypothetical protein